MHLTPCREDAKSSRAVKLGRVSSLSKFQRSLSLVFAALLPLQKCTKFDMRVRK